MSELPADGGMDQMIKIGFCDDDLSVLDQIQTLLHSYKENRNFEIQYTAFQSPFELLADIERGVAFDVLILDVLMPGENGIDTAAEIRNHDDNVKIIFLTTSPEFAVQSYSVSAYYYQLKPIEKDGFFRLMDSVIDACKNNLAKSLILQSKGGIMRIELGRLEYCEVIHRTLFFHMTNGKVTESIGSMDELCSRLEPYSSFLRVHRSYVINLEHIRSISGRSVTMESLSEIPISRKKYNEIKEAFLEYSFLNRQVMI